MSAEPIVYVVDDDDAVRRSLRWLVESVGLAVRTCGGAAEFLPAYDRDAPGCLLLDVRMPDASGLELLQQLNEAGDTIPVIIVTGHADVPMAVQAFKSGAIDFVEKPFNYQTLLDRIHHALDRDRLRRKQSEEMRLIEQRLEKLSPRERQVMDLVVTGKLNKQIADDLGISAKTVEMHRAHLMAKMQADSLAELVRMAMAVRLT